MVYTLTWNHSPAARGSTWVLNILWRHFMVYLTIIPRARVGYEIIDSYNHCERDATPNILVVNGISALVIHQIFFLTRDWTRRVTWPNTYQLELGIIREYTRSSQLTVFFFCLFFFKLEAHSFPRALLSENCSRLGTDNVRGQMSEHVFAPNGGYCLHITLPIKIQDLQ